MSFNVAIVQMNIAYKDPEENRRNIRGLIEQACQAKPDIVVLPETCTTAYSESVFHEIEKYAEAEDGPTLRMMREMAMRFKVWVVTGSLPEKDGASTYNTVFMIDRTGNIVSKYRKMHLYSAMDEDVAFANGTEMEVFDTEFCMAAMMTCYDIRFVELSRTFALRGAKVIFVVANFPNPKVNHWRTLLQARAIENQLYIVACNRVGAAEGNTYFGHSLIIDPWGEIIAEGSDEESILTGEINIETVENVRKKIPMYWDRQPESYQQDLLKKAKFID